MNNDSLALALDRFSFYAKDAMLSLTQCICKPDATLKINGRSYKIEKLLGEGGFSFVYLVQDTSSGRKFALKKILITSGPEGVAEAMKEVEAYRRFRHPNIIKILDSAVVQDPAGEGKIIYLFLPYYSQGNLQDTMTRSSISGEPLSDQRILQIFLQTCMAVEAMHRYRLPSTSAYPPAQSNSGELDPVFDGDEDLQGADAGEMIPYAHRDIKPGNIMLADDGSAILMDFGSTVKARIPIETRQQALLQQDLAGEQSTMPYRAPELFDVRTGTTLDEKVDIWSLGCTLFAIRYGRSPFEIDGSSIAMAAGSGRYTHPPGASRILVGLIDKILVVDPTHRPDIEGVIALTKKAIQEMT
ncbi:putative serine/threonine-protein kinase [Kockovaella imperatae]|uniref:non-specific serine/threonine protein kinase n=1 Tax=Kockovaella imperatae TaxID=4999 RepID=A0A1Y1UPE3_9TREE|nr:putative serine/threonine-protein kinase [Kockovaella imperatae]ORX39901.1 putative serine/threonine-protein kinase [Kockovaella imperatae]